MSTAPDVTTLVGDESAGVFVLLDNILRSTVNAFAKENVTLPTRQIISATSQPVDCEQLVVSFGQLYLGTPSTEAMQPVQCNTSMTVVAEVALTRCVPTMIAGRGIAKPPTPDALATSALKILRDAYLLLEAGRDMEYWDLGGPGLGVIATVDVGEPKGGFLTTMLSITTTLP